MPSSWTDHSALHEVYCALFRNLDDRKLDGLADQYHPDATVRFYLSREQRDSGAAHMATTGSDNLIADMKKFFTQVDATHHTLSNFVTNAVGDEAAIKASIRAYHRGSGTVAGTFEESLAVIDSKARKESDGAWRITELNYTVLVVLGSAEVFGESFIEA